MKKWYPRLAEVPRVGYQGSPGVDRTRLPGCNAKPQINHYEWDGKRHESLSWPMKDGSTSASPANQLQSTSRPGETPAQTAHRHCLEAIELPGTLSDYHFIVQNAHEEIWKHRRREPWVVAETERLCWLDITLVQAYPEILVFDQAPIGTELHYARVVAFYRLLRLYEQEGYLQDALKVAKIALRFGQLPSELERVEGKIRMIEAEEKDVT